MLQFMSRPKTWKIVRWDNKPADTVLLPTECPHCGVEAVLEVGSLPKPIAGLYGLRFVFEPSDYPIPDSWSPQEIECRSCRHVFQG